MLRKSRLLLLLLSIFLSAVAVRATGRARAATWPHAQGMVFTCVQYRMLGEWPAFVPYGSNEAWVIDPFLLEGCGELSVL